MKKCRGGPCQYVSNGGFCTLPEDSVCVFQEECDANKITIRCDEITLTKDSIGIKVDMSIMDFDGFETIEINGRVFKRVREE